MTAGERLEPRHALAIETMSQSPFWPAAPQPTSLAVNFDGGLYQTYAVAPYAAATPLVTDQNIQDILFRTAEIYAPFNVEVFRIAGNGFFLPTPRTTTVFVGPAATAATAGGGLTPNDFADFPSLFRFGHLRNSDVLDMAFVDAQPGATSIGTIATRIAHEGAHTFGLWHVRTDSMVDPSALVTDPDVLATTAVSDDVMTYTSRTSLQYFAMAQLPITIWNRSANGPTLQPIWQPLWKDQSGNAHVAATQSSYDCLRQVLGPRAADGMSHVADVAAVEPIIAHAPGFVPTGDTLVSVNGRALADGSLTRRGDYDVYRWTSPRDQDISVSSVGGGGLDAVTLVYDETGSTGLPVAPNRLLFIQDSLGARVTDPVSAGKPGRLHVTKGQVLNIVVGAHDGVSKGTYRLSLQEERHQLTLDRVVVKDHLAGTPAQLSTLSTSVAVSTPNGSVTQLAANAFVIDVVAGLDQPFVFRIDVVRKAMPKLVAAVHVAGFFVKGPSGFTQRFQVGYADGSTAAVAAENGFWTLHHADGAVQKIAIAAVVPFASIPLAKLARLVTPPPGAALGVVRTITGSYQSIDPFGVTTLTASDGVATKAIGSNAVTIVLPGKTAADPDVRFIFSVR